MIGNDGIEMVIKDDIHGFDLQGIAIVFEDITDALGRVVYPAVNLSCRRRHYDFPVAGEQPIYLNGYDEQQSLSKNIDANSIGFWMGFGDHYINVFTVLRTLGFLSHLPVTPTTGQEVLPLKIVKALLPDPMTLAPGYTGNICIGNFVKGWKDGKEREMLIYQVSDHKQCYEEVESRAISYTAVVPPVAAAILIAFGTWDVKKMVNVEETPGALFRFFSSFYQA
jgi:saccharopine dehydrogenase-like NADP-dependent oxidoreductase